MHLVYFTRMNDALEKTLILFTLMVFGFLLKPKFKNQDQINGIKEMVLSVALPSMIFIALMNINIDKTMVLVPLLTIVFNFFMYVITPFSFPLFGIEKDSSTGRTLQMLIPSLAPGLSCFPFVAEFLGSKSVAIGALADVGNKFFVLIFLYLIALNMFLKNTKSKEQKVGEKLKSLLLTMVKEPINIIIFIAIILLSFGVNYDNLPRVLTGVLDKTSAMMTPLILLFIGLAVQLKKGMKRTIVSVLLFRSGVTLLFSTFLIYILAIQDPVMVLIATVIPQSSASFWPFAHISLFNAKEASMEIPQERRTFNLEQAVLILAFSLPFSTLIILGILSSGTLFTSPKVSVSVAVGLILLGVGRHAFEKLKEFRVKSDKTAVSH